MLFSEALQEFLIAIRGETASSTVEWYKCRLDQVQAFLGNPPVETITLRDLRRWRAAILNPSEDSRPTRSPATINGYIRAIRRFFSWLEKEGLITKNPARDLRFVQVPDSDPKAISEEDMRKMLEAAQNHPRDYAILCFLIDTGCRARGLVTLTLDRLDLSSRRAVVEEKHPGGTRARVVYFSETAQSALARWLEHRPPVGHNYVFVSQRGGRLSVWGLYRVFKRWAKRAGIKGRFNPHAFRHAFARTLLKNGASLDTVSKLMGHSSVMVTSRFYARWAPSELAELHERYSPLNSILGGPQQDF